MSPILWHDGALDRLDRGDVGPVVWRVDDPGRGRRAGLASSLVAHLADRDTASVRLARSVAGAPLIVDPAGWHLGLAGRGGQCLIAVAPCPIAVDREVIGDDPPLWDMLTMHEAEALQALDPKDRPRAWLRRWTIKEAHAKLTGEPRRLAPETIETRVIDRDFATAACEGVSHCWTRERDGAIDTVACWKDAT
ncbi:4'-phosphopantetheinyl transferase family protein [Sphingomonas sp. Leaf21]|uniref:4'-phosphopantetheinyl transferase family protein n=1 Tax=Sphingomonas sp. Leaf21 TaxID=2876550 RepID=UPI001E44E2A4|nr:4'-phosphopantetheinyl transferase superfamily protein [Sphingomonas sp. Leaf21]